MSNPELQAEAQLRLTEQLDPESRAEGELSRGLRRGGGCNGTRVLPLGCSLSQVARMTVARRSGLHEAEDLSPITVFCRGGQKRHPLHEKRDFVFRTFPSRAFLQLHSSNRASSCSGYATTDGRAPPFPHGRRGLESLPPLCRPASFSDSSLSCRASSKTGESATQGHSVNASTMQTESARLVVSEATPEGVMAWTWC